MITLMDTAKAMVRESLPIKCMEAVILAICLTNGIPGLGRFPINFKSEVNEASLLKGRKYYYHVVLGIAYKVRQTFVNIKLLLICPSPGQVWCTRSVKKKLFDVQES